MRTNETQTRGARTEFSDPLLRDGAAFLTVPKPDLAKDVLAAVLREGWGVSGTLSDLGGERDSNSLVTDISGRRFVLKVFSAAEGDQTRWLQHDILMHLKDAKLDFVPRLLPTLTGARELPVESPGGDRMHAALIDHLPGKPPVPDGTRAQLAAVGGTVGQLTSALARMDNQTAKRLLLWDQANVHRLEELTRFVPDSDMRGRILHALDRLRHTVGDRLTCLPSQVIHNDLSTSNILMTNPRHISGVIDFGDAVWAPRINDIAIAASYFMRTDLPLDPQLTWLVEGFERELPLGEDERELIAPMVTARLIVRILIPHWRAALFPENGPYILRHVSAALALAEKLLPPQGGDLWAFVPAPRRGAHTGIDLTQRNHG